MNLLIQAVGVTGENACINIGTYGFQFTICQTPGFYGISDGCTLLNGISHCVYFCKECWESKHHLGCVNLSEICSKIPTL